jgi:hypothetical protein
MTEDSVFTSMLPELQSIFDDLRSREPIFHTERFGRSLEDFELGTAPDFWEVGASGRRYSREYILNMRRNQALVDADAAGWKASEFRLRRLGPGCFLLTYTLDQQGRVTRRATVWERVGESWRIVYHQGTIVTANEDEPNPKLDEISHGSRPSV